MGEVGLWLREPAYSGTPCLKRTWPALGTSSCSGGLKDHVLALGYLSYMDLPWRSQQRPREQI